MSDPRFETAEQSEVYAELMRHEPPMPGSYSQLVFLFLLTVASGAMIRPFFSVGVEVVMPALIAVVSGGFFINLLRVVIRLNFAPLVRQVVIVRAKGRDSGVARPKKTVSSSYSVTVETRTGEQLSFALSPKIAHRIKPEDFGVAYLRAGLLLDFKPL